MDGAEKSINTKTGTCEASLVLRLLKTSLFSLSRKDAVAITGIAKMDAKLVAHEEYPINTIIIHEDFDNKTMRNNIALLKTDTAMQFNSLVQPICFLSQKLNRPPLLLNCWVAGWNPTSAVNGFLLLEQAVCVPAAGVTRVNHSRA